MRRSQALALFAVLALTAAACGDNTTTPTGGGTTPPGSPTNAASPLTNQGTSDVTGMSSFSIELDDRYFKPTFFKATAGQALNIELENEGTLPHTFTIDTLNVDHTVQPGAKMEIDLTLPAGGSDVPFYCMFHGAGGMRGAFFFGATPTAVGSTDNGSTY